MPPEHWSCTLHTFLARNPVNYHNAVVAASQFADKQARNLQAGIVRRFVSRLQVFPDMHHLDVAGGTGDIGLRVRRAIDSACKDAAQHLDDPILQVSLPF